MRQLRLSPTNLRDKYPVLQMYSTYAVGMAVSDLVTGILFVC